jgi:hypothetical protein
MEILLTLLNIISSFITEVLYDISLVNDLFLFDLDKKLVVFNHKIKINKSFDERNITTDQLKTENNNKIENPKEFENQKIIEITSKENLNELKTLTIDETKRKAKKTKYTYRNARNPRPFNEINNNKLVLEENINVKSIENKNKNDELPTDRTSKSLNENKLKSIYINNWIICCFCCINRKKNINKALFEEGSRILTQRLDVVNMFNHFYIMELMQKNMGIEPKEMRMSDICKNAIQMVNANNILKIIER